MADLPLPTPPTTAPASAAPAASPVPAGAAADPKEDAVDNEKVESTFKSRISTSKKHRKTFTSEWKRNIQLRLGKTDDLNAPDLGDDEETRTTINPDWSLTKAKTANLFSQVPQVQGTHAHLQYAAAVPPFMKSLNYEISDKRANAAAAMEEAANDMVNASGFAAVYIGYSALFETVQVPAIDTAQIPPQALQILQQAGKLPMKASERVSSDKFFMCRISPTDALWPKEFNGSDFNQADYTGNSGTLPWAMAKHEFHLKDEDKDQVLGGEELKGSDDSLRENGDGQGSGDTRVVRFDQLFYWRHRVDPDETDFTAIWRIVFVHGMDKAVIHGPWKGQKRNGKGRIVGAVKFPVQIGTLTYISDNPIPPSDSSAGRPQVQDMQRSRDQMFQNRANSLPLRWFDVNRVDTTIQDSLMRGGVQRIIPMNGDGARAIGEVARASYPSEDFTFDQEVKQDLIETWQLQPTMGTGSTGGRQTKAEAQANQQNFATRIGQERGRFAQFFLNCCEVLAGQMALYSDFPILTDQEKQQMQQTWNDKEILADLVLDILPDSSIVLDTSSRLDRIFKFINMTVKSGYVNPEPLIREACQLTGFDPNEILIQPKPKPPDEPTVSLRLTGKDDLTNPISLAFFLRQNLITPQEIEKAKQLLEQMQQGPQPPQQQSAGAVPPAAGPHIPHPSEPPAHPDFHLPDRVAKRSRDVSGG